MQVMQRSSSVLPAVVPFGDAEAPARDDAAPGREELDQQFGRVKAIDAILSERHRPHRCGESDGRLRFDTVPVAAMPRWRGIWPPRDRGLDENPVSRLASDVPLRRKTWGVHRRLGARSSSPQANPRYRSTPTRIMLPPSLSIR